LYKNNRFREVVIRALVGNNWEILKYLLGLKGGNIFYIV